MRPLNFSPIRKGLSSTSDAIYNQAPLGSNSEILKLEAFMGFLIGNFRALEALGAPKKIDKIDEFIADEAIACVFCQTDHFSIQCSMIKALSIPQRKNLFRCQIACHNSMKKYQKVENCP